MGSGRDALNLGGPASLDVFKAGGVDDGVAQDEDVGLVVREGAQTLVILLARRVEELQRAWPAVDVDSGGEGVEDGRDVVGWELVLGVGVDHAGLADGAVADEDGFDADELIRAACSVCSHGAGVVRRGRWKMEGGWGRKDGDQGAGDRGAREGGWSGWWVVGRAGGTTKYRRWTSNGVARSVSVSGWVLGGFGIW